jgi:hypothetical protein
MNNLEERQVSYPGHLKTLYQSIISHGESDKSTSSLLFLALLLAREKETTWGIFFSIVFFIPTVPPTATKGSGGQSVNCFS